MKNIYPKQSFVMKKNLKTKKKSQRSLSLHQKI